jgi:hypothetical protein
MKKIIALSLIALLVLTPVVPQTAHAALSTDALADKMLRGQELFDQALDSRNKKIDAIMSNPGSSATKQQMVRNLQDEFLQKSRNIHEKYRQPFLERIVDETNKDLPKGKKIEVGKGSSFYELDDKGKPKIDKKTGKKIVNTTHRGMQGDLDLGGDPVVARKLEEKMNKYGIQVTSDAMDAPGYRDFKTSEMTINVKGHRDPPGSSAHQTQVQMDAFSKETYASYVMDDNQPGKKLVETNDHIKKAAPGFSTDAKNLLSHRSEDVLQGMGKGTLKSMDWDPDNPHKPQHVHDNELKKILKDTGYKGDVDSFKKTLVDIKEGHLAHGVGLDDKNIKSFQEACKKTAEKAVDNAKAMADRDFKKANEKIKKFNELANSPDTPEAQKKLAKKKMQKLQEDLADSKVRIDQTTLANREKMKGGGYDTFYEKNIAKVPSPAKPPSRIDAIKGGLKPDLMSAAGYAMSAYTTYDTLKQLKEGTISKSDAAIILAKESIDTGFGIVTDVGTGAAISSTIGTGSLGTAATIAAPMVVFMASGYAISQAAEDGLKMAQSFKDEEILALGAKSKTEETVNTLQLTGEEMVKAGNATGDWRYFAKADDAIYALGKLHDATGDDFYLTRADQLSEHVNKAKEDLEKKYGCSIYAVKQKMEDEQRVEFEKKQQAAAEAEKAAQAETAAQAEKVAAEIETRPQGISPAPSSPQSAPPVAGTSAPTSAADADYVSKGQFRVQAFHTELSMAIGPNDASRDLWVPVQQYVLGSLQKVLRNNSELARIGKLSDAEWAREKADIWKNMGSRIATLAGQAAYDPAYENIINNWKGSGYISPEEAAAAIENMKSNSQSGDKKAGAGTKRPEGSAEGTGGKASSAKGKIVDYYYVGVWLGDRNNPARFDTIPVKYGDYVRPITLDGKSLYTNSYDDTGVENIKRDISKYLGEGGVRYNVYPGKAELKNGKVTILSKANKPIEGFGGAGKGKKDAAKKEAAIVQQMSQAIGNVSETCVEKIKALKASPQLVRWQELKARFAAMEPEVAAAKARKDVARHNALVIQWNALTKEQRQISGSSQMRDYKKYLKFSQELYNLRNGTGQQIHDYIMNSGLAQELGYNPPPSFKNKK